MGYEQKKIEIWASVSRHNSDRDVQDNRLWADLAARVRAIVSDPLYASINVDAMGAEPDHA